MRPRIRKSKFAVFFESLGETFTIEEFERNYSNRTSAQVTISRLISQKLIERGKNGAFKKLVEDINDIPSYKVKE